MSFPVFLDTCALYPGTLCDTLLRIAERGVYRPHWSADVLAELERNLAKLPSVGIAGAQRRVGHMTGAFEDAMVTGYTDLVSAMTCHPKDAHVLAAAVASECQVIVTFNVKDFPPESVQPHDLDIVHPDDFLLDQLDLYPAAVVSALSAQSRESSRPQLTRLGLAASMERCGLPKFSAEFQRKVDAATWESARRD